MMLIGVIDANDQLIEAELSERLFIIGLSWNEEGQLWTLSIRDLNRTILASGIAVVTGWPLLRQVRRPEFPVGDLYVDAPLGVRLGRRSFVDDVARLFYYTQEDLA